MDEPIHMGPASDIEALEDLGLKAIDLFHEVETALQKRADQEWPEDLFKAESQRFELWAANMGLFVAGHGSLDYRVREAETLAKTLRRFMQDLNTSLEDVVEMCSEPQQEDASGINTSSRETLATRGQGAAAMDEEKDEDEDEDEESLDMDLLVDSIRDPINRLFKMSTKIRNPSTRLGSSRAANYRQVDEETGVDLLQAMKEFDSDYVRSMFLEYRKTNARRESPSAQPSNGPQGENDDEVWEPIKTVLMQEKERESTGANSYLIERIAQANVRRRQQFAYWARHRDKLEKHTKAYRAQKGRLPTMERHKGGGLGLEAAPSGPVPSITTASKLDISRLEISSDTRSNWTLSEYAPSTHQATDGPVDFPPAPKIPRKSQTDKFFECPYCFFLCPRNILAEKAWKAHLIHDLRPYLCTYEDCRNPTQLYDSRKDWVQHENSEHRKVWRCLEHSKKVYESLDTYKRHLREQHAGSISGEASLTRIVQASESVADVPKRTCPICAVELDTGRYMEGHIALHLERFARFSLPRSTGNEDDGSNADSGHANKVDEEGSRDDDFEGRFDIRSGGGFSEAQSTGRSQEVGTSSPPPGIGASGGTLKELQASDDDDDESSSGSGGSHREIQQPTEDETTFHGVQVGEWCTDFEKYERVEREFWEALEQTERRLGSHHPDTLDCMDRLEHLLSGQCKFKEAEQMSRRILEQRERLLGRGHPQVWECMNEVAHLLYLQDMYEEAEKINREVLTLREKEWGRENAETLLSLSNLGITLARLDRVEEAEKLGREAMESRKKVLGLSHPDTLLSMRNLAHALVRLGQFEEAERLHSGVADIMKQELGHDHPETLSSIIDMTESLYEQNRLDEVEKVEAETLEASMQNLGSNHPITLRVMHNRAWTWHTQGRLREAIDLMGECLRIRRQALGPEHRSTITTAEDLEEWRAELEQPNS